MWPVVVFYPLHTPIGKTILLGDIIDAVQQHDGTIVEFYYGACRGDYSGSAVKSALIRGAIEVFR